MKYSLYTGCIIPVTAPNYEISVKKVCECLDVKIEPFPAPCCGNPLNPINAEEAVRMAWYVLGLAAEREYPLMTLCSSCNTSLKGAQKEIDEDFLQKFNFSIQKVKNLEIEHFLQVLHKDVGVELIKEKIKTPIKMKAAVHYGCHLLRPSLLYDHDPEYPAFFDELVNACGAESISYKSKSMCCGSPLVNVDYDLSLALAARKLLDIKNSADCLVVSCGGCGFMFDRKQKSVESLTGPVNIPVLYYSQILGLALDIPVRELGVQINRVSTRTLLNQVIP